MSVFIVVNLLQNLRCILEGDRPSQTASCTNTVRLNCWFKHWVLKVFLGWYFQGRLWDQVHARLPPILHKELSKQYSYAIVKVHGVFPSSHNYSASSRKIQFHWISTRDSRKVVTSFMRDGTYPSRSFATLGPSKYSRRLPYLSQKLLTTFLMLGHRADVRPYT